MPTCGTTCQPQPVELGGHRLLEGRFEPADRAQVLGRQRDGAALGEVEEGLEVAHAHRLGAAGSIWSAREAGEDDELLARARHRDVEPPLAAVAVERAEIHGALAGGVLRRR